MVSYIYRTLQQAVVNASRYFPVVLIGGARQVGKTTYLKHCSEANRTYVTLDDFALRALAKEDPALFFQRFPPPVLHR